MNAGVMMVPGDPALLEVEGYGRRSLGPLYDDLRDKLKARLQLSM